MSYQKQNFKAGDVLTSAQLNHMDDQIALNEANINAKKDVTAANIKAVLNYTPANASELGGLSSEIDTKLDKSALAEVESRIDNSKRELDLLWKLNQGISYSFERNSDAAYSKIVPSGAKGVSINSVGAKTLVWNQIQSNNRSVITGGVKYEYNNDNGTLTISATGETRGNKAYWLTSTVGKTIDFIQGHKYMFAGFELLNRTGAYIPNSNSLPTLNLGGLSDYIITMDGNRNVYLQIMISDTFDLSTPIVVKPQIFDLTTMFGAGKEPTAEEFRRMFPADSYPYSEPMLMSYEPNEVVNRGKNLLNFNDYADVTERYGLKFTVNPDGSVRIVGTPTTTVYYNVMSGTTKHPELKEVLDGTSFGQSDKYDYVARTSTNSKGETIAFSAGLSKNANNTVFWTFRTGVTYDETRYPYIYKGEIAPYVPGRDSITTGLSALVSKYFSNGMKSAGDVHDEIDLERGVAVKRVESVDLGTLTWASTTLSDKVMFKAALSDAAPDGNAITPACEQAKGSFNNVTDGKFRLVSNSVYVNNAAYTDKDLFGNAMAGVMLYYELAEPIETKISDEDMAKITTILSVEAGGSLTFHNNQEQTQPNAVALPNTIDYIISTKEAVQGA